MKTDVTLHRSGGGFLWVPAAGWDRCYVAGLGWAGGRCPSAELGDLAALVTEAGDRLILRDPEVEAFRAIDAAERAGHAGRLLKHEKRGDRGH
jgi:hypothetical protein